MLPEKFVIIDGNSLLYRAFYALPLMQSRRGEHTNAVYGFTNMLFRLLEEEKPDYVTVAFDPPSPSFRVEIDPAYKAQRKKTPAELVEQMRRAREILAAMGIPVFEVDGYEADDVIGTLALMAAGKERNVTVVSGDADLLQLVSKEVHVMLTKKGISSMERYDLSTLNERYQMTPAQFIDYKALRGDPSDNIPGVPGIGEKTARKLLAQFGSIENIYDNMGELKGRIAENLTRYREALYQGRNLVRLRLDVPLEPDWESCRFSAPHYEQLLKLFSDLEFKSLINRLKAQSGDNSSAIKEELRSKQMTGPAEFSALLEKLGKGDKLALLTEPAGGRPSWRQPVAVLTAAPDAELGYFIVLEGAGKKQTKICKALAAACSRGVSLITHNAKQLYHLFLQEQINLPVISFDTYLAAYLADPARGGYDLPGLLTLHLGVEEESAKEKKKELRDLKQFGEKAANRARLLFDLQHSLQEQLDEQELEPLLYDLELPLAETLARMEQRGITVDVGYLSDLSAEICSRLNALEKEIYALAGEEFNLNSPQQLSNILFDKLGLPEIRKTKTGRSTDARVLEELAANHEIAALLLHYRQLTKLEGTYLSGLIELVDQDDQKIFTTLNQAATSTGRLSSSDPNLQNIPVRLEEGRRIRRAFIPSTGEKIFFAADYSQVELRILAHLSQDLILVEAFNTGQDIHSRTAAEVNGIPLDQVTPAMREKAKAVNFGIIYGSSDYGLAQSLKISRAEAKAYIDGYFERYSGVKEYMEYIIGQAREHGYVTTLLNRRRYLPEIHSSNHNIRSFAERMALNSPIQGAAADIIKLAMLKIDRIIIDGGFKAAMLLQIHDELLFEIEKTEIDFFAPLIQREMEQAFTLSVPLKVDLKWGSSWEELKKI